MLILTKNTTKIKLETKCKVIGEKRIQQSEYWIKNRKIVGIQAYVTRKRDSTVN